MGISLEDGILIFVFLKITIRKDFATTGLAIAQEREGRNSEETESPMPLHCKFLLMRYATLKRHL